MPAAAPADVEPGDHDGWSYRGPEEVTETTWVVDGGYFRVCIRAREIPDGTVVDFAVVLQIRIQDGWHNAVKVDTRHGGVHAHHYTRRGHESRQPLPQYDNAHRFGKALDRVIWDFLWPNWEVHLRRWRDDHDDR